MTAKGWLQAKCEEEPKLRSASLPHTHKASREHTPACVEREAQGPIARGTFLENASRTQEAPYKPGSE